MKTIIAGGRDFDDYTVVKKAIQQAIDQGLEITEVVSGGARGVDKLGERWAKENCIPLKIFPAKWTDLKQEGAVIKTRKNPWTGKIDKYNANAGFFRNEEMAVYAEGGALIPIEGGGGTRDMTKKAKAHDITIYEYEMQDEDYEYKF